MSTVITARPPPPPPPPPSRLVTSVGRSPSAPPPPPPPTTAGRDVDDTEASTPLEPQFPLRNKSLIEDDDSKSEAVTSSIITASPNDEDQLDVPSTSPPTSSRTPPLPKAKHADLLEKTNEALLSTSSMASSPRRPRRAGTGIPENTRVSDLDFEVSDDIGPSARDEFEEEFLNGNAADGESQMISDVLERVDFRQLSEDEEILSDDAPDSVSDVAARRRNHLPDRPEYETQRRRNWDYDSVDFGNIRQSTVHTNWRRIPSEVGCEGCQGCDRLCGENRKLRRQLDELEFELASGVLHNPPDGFDRPEMPRQVPPIPQIPTLSKKKKGWTNKLRNSTALPMSSTKPGERARLRAEVQALTVTTEYLWRKLNKAEGELRNYRLKELRNRMQESAETSNDSSPNHVGVRSRERHLDLVGGNDWDWE